MLFMKSWYDIDHLSNILIKYIMVQSASIKLFQDRNIRTIWDEEQEKWYFSIIDVIAVLTESDNPRKYWSVLKTRLKSEGSQLATNCSQLKMPGADGKMRETDAAELKKDWNTLY